MFRPRGRFERHTGTQPSVFLFYYFVLHQIIFAQFGHLYKRKLILIHLGIVSCIPVRLARPPSTGRSAKVAFRVGRL